MIHRFDLWLGKTLFIPIAIRICQLLKISQYALHTYIWFFVSLSLISRGPHVSGGWAMYVLLCLCAVVWTILAGLEPEAIKRSTTWLRRLFIGSFAFDLFVFFLTAYLHKSPHWTIFYLVRDWWIVLAEYALTITTIPPLEEREKKTARKLARQES